jgi:hypothetical protein
MQKQPNLTKPTKKDIALAVSKTVLDIIAPGLSVLFCGINPDSIPPRWGTTLPDRGIGSGRR